jgi:hypothetical protein
LREDEFRFTIAPRRLAIRLAAAQAQRSASAP